jgi:hypothetical protein
MRRSFFVSSSKRKRTDAPPTATAGYNARSSHLRGLTCAHSPHPTAACHAERKIVGAAHRGLEICSTYTHGKGRRKLCWCSRFPAVGVRSNATTSPSSCTGLCGQQGHVCTEKKLWSHRPLRNWLHPSVLLSLSLDIMSMYLPFYKIYIFTFTDGHELQSCHLLPPRPKNNKNSPPRRLNSNIQQSQSTTIMSCSSLSLSRLLRLVAVWAAGMMAGTAEAHQRRSSDAAAFVTFSSEAEIGAPASVMFDEDSVSIEASTYGGQHTAHGRKLGYTRQWSFTNLLCTSRFVFPSLCHPVQ